MTIRTPITPQQNLIIKTVKKCGHESMTPDPITASARTHRRSEPREISPLQNNLLDGNINRDYHKSTFFRATSPYMVRAVAPLKLPPSFSPSILILFPLRSRYYEKITPFLSIECEKQHPPCQYTIPSTTNYTLYIGQPLPDLPQNQTPPGPAPAWCLNPTNCPNPPTQSCTSGTCNTP